MEEHTQIPTSSEVNRGQSEYNLTPDVRMKPVAQNVIEKNSPEKLDLSNYQRALLEEFRKRPAIMKLLRVLFQEYPAYIVKEYRQTLPHASKRQKAQSRITAIERLKVEAFVEEEIAKLAGIDLNSLEKKYINPDPEAIKEDNIKIKNEIMDQIEEEMKSGDEETTAKKTTKKKTKKKTTKKTSKKRGDSSNGEDVE